MCGLSFVQNLAAAMPLYPETEFHYRVYPRHERASLLKRAGQMPLYVVCKCRYTPFPRFVFWDIPTQEFELFYDLE